MKIKTVTITGADNNTSIDEMLLISKEFPFVEWGILFSPKKTRERYPDLKWIAKLVTKSFKENIQLSAHLCGDHTRQMLVGYDTIQLGKHIFEPFNRFQLNFNSMNSEVDQGRFFSLLNRLNLNFILQYNYSNVAICSEAMKSKNISFLYDSSGGRGTEPAQYMKPIKNHFTGYAGGLSPDNLEDELKKIDDVAGDSEIWIDTESRVRTNEILDMNKVRKFLQIAEKWVE